MSSWRGETGIQRLVLADGRRIELPGLMNLRDVGGYPAGGGFLRWRALLRSDGLHRLDAGDAAVLAGVGLRTIVDLRTPAETQIAPSMLDGLTARRRARPGPDRRPERAGSGAGVDLPPSHRGVRCRDRRGRE